KDGGFAAFKIKVGIGRPDADGERTRRICEALGRDVLVCSDANTGWNTEEAVQYVRAVAGSGLAFFEQPVAADDVAAMAAGAAAPDLAIGADETIHSLADIRRHHEHKAARGASLKTIKLGGMRGVYEAGLLCERLGMAVNVSCKTGENRHPPAAAPPLPSPDPALPR